MGRMSKKVNFKLSEVGLNSDLFISGNGFLKRLENPTFLSINAYEKL